MTALSGCKGELDDQSRALLSSESAITLPYVETTKTVMVYADGKWAADVTDTWLSITPTSGNGSVEVTIHAKLNEAETPRAAEIVVAGGSTVDNLKISVTQKGDRFKNASTYSVSELPALEAGTLAKVSECQVMAFTTTGFVISDGKSNIYVNGVPEGIKAGDKITLNGDMVVIDGLKAIQMEDAFLASSAEATLPQATDITSGIASYAPGAVTFVTFTGTYSGGKFVVNDKDAGVPVSPVGSLGMSTLDLHNVAVTGYYIGTDSGLHFFVVTSAEDKGMAGKIYLQFEIENSDFTAANSSTFPATSQFNAKKGNGYIKYVPFDLSGTNGNNKYKLDISGNDPRCTGPWPEDYWLFYGNDPIKSGSQVQIKFGARTSATGHKYWKLEYLDGKTWKTAGTPLMTTDLANNVEYTHAMNADGATNITVNETVTFTRNVEHGQFRFRCVANWQANGSGALAARNGGSARLAVESAGNNAPQPTIMILKEGDGSASEPVEANITSSVSYLTFEGTPAGPKTLTVNSDQAFTATSSASWLKVDPASGAANKDVTLTVTCDPSELSTLREATITVLAGETEYKIPVIQSAAGVELKPLLSISGGNSLKVTNKAGSSTVNVQANVDVSAKSDVSWITVSAVPTKAMVEEKGFSVAYEENTGDNDRVGHVTFYNSSDNLEAVLTVTQSGAAYFNDDLSWLQTWADAEGAGDSVGNQDSGAAAPNSYTVASAAAFQAEFAKRGYEDLNPDAKVMYLQKYYLKFSKSKVVGGIRLPAVNYGSSPVNVTFSFDWCAHMGGTGTVDKTVLVVELENAGTFVDTGTAKSNEISSTQAAGQMFWQHITLKIQGATSATRITIKPTTFGATSGYYRYHLDNFKIVDTK